MTAHKTYGPKGVGALYVRRGDVKLELEPLMDGGGHERGLRSGTLNVPGIVGFGKAAEIAKAEMATESPRLAALRDRLLGALRAGVADLHVNGSLDARLPHNLNVSFPGVPGESLLLGIDDICVSAGSACSSGSEEPPVRLEGAGHGRRPRARLHPLRPRPLHHGRRDRLHRRQGGGRRPAVATDVADAGLKPRRGLIPPMKYRPDCPLYVRFRVHANHDCSQS